MIRAGLSLPALMQLMGRAQIQITLAYLQITPQDVVSLAIGVIFGVIPALQISRPEPMEVLRNSSRSTTAGGAEREGWSAEWYPVSSDYFRTLRIPLIRGQESTMDHSGTGRPVAIINAARRSASSAKRCARKTIYIGS
jgi:hypothetical protein